MRLAGLQKLTLLDFPDQVACTVFTRGCDLRCPFCQNPELVLPEMFRNSSDIAEEDFFEFLSRRKGRLSGVAITGGEPTLHADLPDFMKKIHEMGFLVKLDTNGLHPAALRHILQEGLADYVAMDVKNSPEKYALTVGLSEQTPGSIWETAKESIHMLMESGVNYEFRTTVVEGLHTEDDILKMAQNLTGTRAWYLQQFLSEHGIIRDFLQRDLVLSTPAPDTLRRLCDIARPYVPVIQTRGV